jgi:hypothetical protein
MAGDGTYAVGIHRSTAPVGDYEDAPFTVIFP